MALASTGQMNQGLRECIIMENFIKSQGSVQTKDGYYQDTILHVSLFWVHFAYQSLTVLCSEYLFNNVCKGNSRETGFSPGAKRRLNFSYSVAADSLQSRRL